MHAAVIRLLAITTDIANDCSQYRCANARSCVPMKETEPYEIMHRSSSLELKSTLKVTGFGGLGKPSQLQNWTDMASCRGHLALVVVVSAAIIS